MSIEDACRTYVAAWNERDAGKRASLLEACWADGGRLVSHGRTYRGRGDLEAAIVAFQADPQWARVRLTSVIDAGGTTFRFRGVAERHDGSSAEATDAGEVDADGRIALILTFNGPLRDAP
jgi:hypothetical protein